MKYRERELWAIGCVRSAFSSSRSHRWKGSDRLNRFLMKQFGGYTAQAGDIFGYWRENGRDSYGEHREFNVAAPEPEQITK